MTSSPLSRAAGGVEGMVVGGEQPAATTLPPEAAVATPAGETEVVVVEEEALAPLPRPALMPMVRHCGSGQCTPPPGWEHPPSPPPPPPSMPVNWQLRGWLSHPSAPGFPSSQSWDSRLHPSPPPPPPLLLGELLPLPMAHPLPITTMPSLTPPRGSPPPRCAKVPPFSAWQARWLGS